MEKVIFKIFKKYFFSKGYFSSEIKKNEKETFITK